MKIKFFQKIYFFFIYYLGGRKRINNKIILEIDRHMKSLSNIASNRYLKKAKSNAFYPTVSLLQAFNSFKFKNEICFTTFYNYVEDYFKKPFRLTDLCDYCEKKKVNSYKIKFKRINYFCLSLILLILRSYQAN